MNKQTLIRYVSLISFLILFVFFSLRHFILGGKVAASVDALCPFGGFETLFTFIATGGFVPRILMSSLVLAIGILVTVLIFKRGFCGYICPFGTVLEFIGKIKKKKIKINKKIDQPLRYLKYLVLIVTLVGTAITGTLVFRAYDPFMTFFHFGKGIFWDVNSAEFALHLTPFIILIFVLVLSIFFERFWCKYLCPLAATMNIFNKLGLTKIKRDKHSCIDCKICDKSCPVNVKVSNVKQVKSVECINCNICVTNCPKKSLSLNIFNKKFSVFTYVLLLLVTFFLVIGVAKGVGIWQSVPGTSLESGNGITGDNIKGWMTFSDIAEETGISTEKMLEDLNLPSDLDVNLPFNEIGKTYEFEFHTQTVRDYVDNLE